MDSLPPLPPLPPSYSFHHNMGPIDDDTYMAPDSSLCHI